MGSCSSSNNRMGICLDTDDSESYSVRNPSSHQYVLYDHYSSFISTTPSTRNRSEGLNEPPDSCIARLVQSLRQLSISASCDFCSVSDYVGNKTCLSALMISCVGIHLTLKLVSIRAYCPWLLSQMETGAILSSHAADGM